METFNVLQAKIQPSFQESIANGFYLLDRYDGNTGANFRGITADMIYQIYISSNGEISESGQTTEILDPNDLQGSIKKQQNKLMVGQMLADVFHFYPIPPEYIQKISIESLATEITRLSELQKTQPYKDRVNEIFADEE